jgi:4a-hydroxytetrahydrobiopterin dehydratase
MVRRPFDLRQVAPHVSLMSKPLQPGEVTTALAKLAGWSFERDALTKTFQFGSFREAWSFMTRAAFEAEELNHHPEWTNVYNRVVVRLNTHDAGNKVTAKDVELATRMQKISWVG